MTHLKLRLHVLSVEWGAEGLKLSFRVRIGTRKSSNLRLRTETGRLYLCESERLGAEPSAEHRQDITDRIAAWRIDLQLQDRATGLPVHFTQRGVTVSTTMKSSGAPVLEGFGEITLPLATFDSPLARSSSTHEVLVAITEEGHTSIHRARSVCSGTAALRGGVLRAVYTSQAGILTIECSSAQSRGQIWLRPAGKVSTSGHQRVVSLGGAPTLFDTDTVEVDLYLARARDTSEGIPKTRNDLDAVLDNVVWHKVTGTVVSDGGVITLHVPHSDTRERILLVLGSDAAGEAALYSIGRRRVRHLASLTERLSPSLPSRRHLLEADCPL